jgi:beta-glucosidase
LVDVIVVCLGEKPGTEKPGDIDDLTFEKVQLELVKKLATVGKPIILVLTEARPRLITEIEPLVKGVVMAYLPGNEGGRALADILYGDANPSGKLPFTYPKHSGALTTYDHKFSETRDPKFGHNAIQSMYPFGFGLSYTQFKSSNLTINKEKFLKGDSLEVSVSISNIGTRAGKEVVQLYIKDEYATITPSVKRLRGFRKIALQPNESQKVVFKVAMQDLGFVTNDNKWIVEAGDFKVMVGGEEKSFRLEDGGEISIK